MNQINYLETAIGVLSWKRFAVVGASNMAIGLTRYLANAYSFTPLLIIITEPLCFVRRRLCKMKYRFIHKFMPIKNIKLSCQSGTAFHRFSTGNALWRCQY
jgi:hypothetical protein